MEFLTPKDWADFEAEYPTAVAFLRQRQVRNEAVFLLAAEKAGRLTPFQQKRLAEFRALFGETGVSLVAEAASRA